MNPTETMRAVALSEDGTVDVVEKPVPEREPGEALVRIHRVGIDGTDRRIVDREIGEFPDGEDHLVIGHEAVGVVEEPGGTDLAVGDVVVPTVRRPPADGPNEYFERGEPDVAPEGAFVERGIFGAHGYMAEYVTSPGEHLVRIPADLAPYGYLVEPASICEKAVETAVASRSAFTWEPEAALVLGTGSLGLLGLVRLVSGDEFERTYCLGRRDRSDPAVSVVDELDAAYVDSRRTPLSEVADAHEPMDFVYEATGHAPHAAALVDALAPSGVGSLQGVPGSRELTIDVGTLHRDLVLGNRVLLGVVNSRVDHFEAAAETLRSCPERVLESLVGEVYEPEAVERALADRSHPKAAVSFSELE